MAMMKIRALFTLALIHAMPAIAAAQSVEHGATPEPDHGDARAFDEAQTQQPTDRASLRAWLAQRREVHLAQPREYVETGVFPINSYRAGLLNVFIDDEGHI